MRQREEFATANRAFDLMTLDERHRVLQQFARLQYPSIQDRFFEAVHRIVTNTDQAAPGPEKP